MPMSTIGSLVGSPQKTATTSTSSGSEVSPATTTTAPTKEKVKEKESAPAPAPPPEPARLDPSTGYNLVRVLGETAPVAESEPSPAKPVRPEPGPVLDGSDAALRLMQDTARELETRRTQDAERRRASEPQDGGDSERPAASRRLDPATAEKNEARRDDLFQQRAAARGVNLYQTGLEPRDDSGAALNARF